MKANDKSKNSYWSTFKEIWKNKRYRSLIILGLYAVFFIFVFLIINGTSEVSTVPKNIETPKTTLENYAEMENYEFTLQLNETKDTIATTYDYVGKTDGLATIINDRYYLKDNVIYEITNNEIRMLSATFIEINLFKLKPYNINQLISEGELNYETKFADDSIEKSYLVPLKTVVKNFKGEDIVDAKSTVEIKYKEKDSEITEIELDLSNYQKYIYPNVESYIIKITYLNVGNVEPLKSDYQVVTSS